MSTHPNATCNGRFKKGDVIELVDTTYAICSASYEAGGNFRLNAKKVGGGKVIMFGLSGSNGSSVTRITSWDW